MRIPNFFFKKIGKGVGGGKGGGRGAPFFSFLFFSFFFFFFQGRRKRDMYIRGYSRVSTE